MATVQNDIVEIRRTVYGRDMRKPLADALQHLKEKYDHEGVLVKRLDEVSTELDDSIIDWIERETVTVIVNYEADSESTTGLTLTQQTISSEYLLTDSRQGDAVTEISGTTSDYLLTLGDENWTKSEMDDESYTEEIEIPHKESYFLILEY